MSSNTTKMALLGGAATLTANTASALHMPGAATAETQPHGMTVVGLKTNPSRDRMNFVATPLSSRGGGVPETITYRVSIGTGTNLPRGYPTEAASEALMDAVQSGGDSKALPCRYHLRTAGGAVIPDGSNYTDGDGRPTIAEAEHWKTENVEHGVQILGKGAKLTFSPFSPRWLAADLRKDIAAALHVNPSVLGVHNLKVAVRTISWMPKKNSEQYTCDATFGCILGDALGKAAFSDEEAPQAKSRMELDIDFEVAMPGSIGRLEAQTSKTITKGQYATSTAHLDKAIATVVTVGRERRTTDTVKFGFSDLIFVDKVIFFGSMLIIWLMCSILSGEMAETAENASPRGEEDNDADSEARGLVVLAGAADDVEYQHYLATHTDITRC